MPDGQVVQTTQVRARVRQDGHTWRTKRRQRGICRDCPRRLHQWKDRCDRCQATERIRSRRYRRTQGIKRARWARTKKPTLVVPEKRQTAKDPLFWHFHRINRYIQKAERG